MRRPEDTNRPGDTNRPDAAPEPAVPGPRAPGLRAPGGEGPAFGEPWEAQALALAVSLQEAGHFTAAEWSAALGEAIAAAQAEGDPDDGTTYYRHVLAALERLVGEKGIAGRDALQARRRDWERAYRATPHGEAVVLPDARGSRRG